MAVHELFPQTSILEVLSLFMWPMESHSISLRFILHEYSQTYVTLFARDDSLVSFLSSATLFSVQNLILLIFVWIEKKI